MKRLSLFFVMAVAVFSMLAAGDMVINKTDGTDIIVPLDEIENITFSTMEYNEVTVEGITFQWMTDDEYLYGMVSAPTTGWVSVGFDPTNQMADANIIIGYVDGGMVSIRDDFGTSATAHASDSSLGGTDDIMEPGGMEENGETMISFKIPLNSGDMYDSVLVPGNNYMIILAYGSGDNFTGFHTLATSTDIDL